MRPHKIVGRVETDGRLIPRKDVEHHSDATLADSFLLGSLHQLPGETFAAMVHCYIQRDDVADSPRIRRFDMQNHEAQ